MWRTASQASCKRAPSQPLDSPEEGAGARAQTCLPPPRRGRRHHRPACLEVRDPDESRGACVPTTSASLRAPRCVRRDCSLRGAPRSPAP
jgi:hypothetical protein